MKSKATKIMVLLVFLWGSLLLVPPAQQAASESTIRLYNVAGQAAFTLIKGVIQGHVRNFRDVVKTLAYGSAAGYGFYQSKRLAGKGNVTAGVMLANLSASISENVAFGRHPLSHIGYNLGPARLDIATPFARNPRAIVNLSVVPRDLVSFVYSLKNADRLSFRNGLLVFTAKDPIQSNALGWTRGIYPTVLEGHEDDYVYHHESIHAIQQIQSISLSPEPLLQMEPGFGESKPRLFSFSGLRMNFLGLGMDLFTSKVQDYNENIYEVEAYHFARK